MPSPATKPPPPTKPQVLTGPELLTAFQLFLRMLDQGCNLKDEDCVSEAKKLVANYIVYLKKAVSDHSRTDISWDAIVNATEESTFFQHCSGLLLQVNSDLKYKPSIECPALHEFAHSIYYLEENTAKELIQELQTIGIRTRNPDLTAKRLIALKFGLCENGINIDGFHCPYQHLLPFIKLGCVRLERLEEEEKLEFIDAGQVVDDVLEDVMDMISAMEVQRKIVS